MLTVPKTLEEFAKANNKSVEVVKRELFSYIDMLMEMNISAEVLDCGLYHNHIHNSPKNMVDSHKALLFAKYDHLCGNIPEPSGPSIIFVYHEEI
jgi:hypothetical protein